MDIGWDIVRRWPWLCAMLAVLGLFVGVVGTLAVAQPQKEPKVSLVRVVDREAGVMCYTLVGVSLTGASGISCMSGPTLGALPNTKVIPVQ